jgi:hypothetical protein
VTSRIATFAAYVVLPVVGILFFGWDWRAVIVLYWLENVTLGLRNVIAMIRTERLSDPGQRAVTVNNMPATSTAAKPLLIVFFVFHYGIFTLVHGVFVFLIVLGVFAPFRSGGGDAGGIGGFGGADSGSIDWGGILLVWGVASVVQLVLDLFRPRESLPSATTLFASPYGRIIALHLTILGGAWLIESLGWPPAAAILLVALHFATDLWSPFGGRKRASGAPSDTMQG